MDSWLVRFWCAGDWAGYLSIFGRTLNIRILYCITLIRAYLVHPVQTALPWASSHNYRVGQLSLLPSTERKMNNSVLGISYEMKIRCSWLGSGITASYKAGPVCMSNGWPHNMCCSSTIKCQSAGCLFGDCNALLTVSDAAAIVSSGNWAFNYVGE